MENRIIVTGAGGFIGSWICNYYADKGDSVLAVGRSLNNGISLNSNILKSHLINLPDKSFIDIIKNFQPTILIHCAGNASVGKSLLTPFNDYKNSVDLSAFILEQIRQEATNCKFILISSAAVYGNPEILPIKENVKINPISPYGYHKRMCEMLVEEYSKIYSIDGVILRIFSAYGEGLRKQVIYDLCRKFLDKRSDTVELFGTGSESRDFIHVLDILNALDCVISSGEVGTFNIGSGEKTTISDLAKLIKKNLNSTKQIHFTGSNRGGDPLCWQADISKINSIGFTCEIPFELGINKYCNWLKLTGI